MISLVVLSAICSVYFYVEAFKWGMHAKKWALGGLILGPILLPMFSISRHIHWRNAVGFNNLYIAA
ncbi:hypothetical protein LHL20_06710 [Alteromonas sp. McT4-15]|uniref:hypothetical protein n=1 Tax=unclassified Alteromonas TaxID=2614992 RepID=UPI0012E5EA69|nr:MULTISPECIES: hypothetical protein [unclassified Alteromonas]MEC8231950.1 hypothetical protein [Pseudomonadota bacterium]GFD87894.1 hypothetical protein KUL152_01200 [Tenacibaculum sp. KUL152]MCB4435936.1 hypothetical protein [Alteromonas sp. McT4-15]WDT87345.1 hypothetical protein OZ660_06215 [Alteromonas sp. 009811495]BCO22320.1 hypothetical protein KUC14_11890 [Alteromonas sp. KC14]